jgi:uncharacterized RDD family membrane protein YckC
MEPNSRSSYIGRVRSIGEPRADLAPPVVDAPLIEPEIVTPVPGPTGTGILPPEPDTNPVAYWRRIVAFALDALTVLGVLFYIQSSTDIVDGKTVRHVAHRGPWPWGDDFAPLITFVVLAFIYEVAFIAARGQTPGKERMKIRVTRVSDGGKPTIRQAMVRSSVVAVLRMVPGTLILTGNVAALVSGVSAPLNMRRRGLNDYLAGTMVVRYDADQQEGKITMKRRPNMLFTDWTRSRVAAVTGRSDDLHGGER